MKLTWSIIELSLYYSSPGVEYSRQSAILPTSCSIRSIPRVCMYVHTCIRVRAHTHTSCEFLFSSPSDDGKAVQGDLWKVAGVNYKVNRDHTIKEFKFVMDIDCWKLLQPGFNISRSCLLFFPSFFFRIDWFIIVIFDNPVKNFSKENRMFKYTNLYFNSCIFLFRKFLRLIKNQLSKILKIHRRIKFFQSYPSNTNWHNLLCFKNYISRIKILFHAPSNREYKNSPVPEQPHLPPVPLSKFSARGSRRRDRCHSTPLGPRFFFHHRYRQG